MPGKKNPSAPSSVNVGSPINTVSITSTIDSIIEDYEKVNRIISFFQDDKARIQGLEKARNIHGIGLELGPGPGNFTRMLRPVIHGPLICLDFSKLMLKKGRAVKGNSDLHFVRGVFEKLPFKHRLFSLTSSAYALRDSTDRVSTLKEVRRTQKFGGKTLIIDIGKPSNSIIRGFVSLYIKYIVPLLGGLIAGYGYNNPWSTIYKTYSLLPENGELLHLLQKMFGKASMDEIALGGLIVALAEKTGYHR